MSAFTDGVSPSGQISQMLKISRNTVKRVIRGEWQDTPRRQSPL